MGTLPSLILFNFRLKSGFLAAWLIPLWTLTAVFPLAYYDYYPTVEERQEIVKAMSTNVGTIALYGRIDPPGYVGQMTSWEMGLWLPLLGSVMSVLLILSLHRRAEDEGTMDLLRSTGVHPGTSTVAATVTTIAAATNLSVGIPGILLAEQLVIDELTTSGAVAFGCTVAVAVAGSGVLAQLVVLLFAPATAVTAVGLVSVAVGFLIRAYADVNDLPWMNWLTPLGWRHHVHPFTDDNWAMLAVAAGIVLGLGTATRAVEKHRAYGYSLVTVSSPKTQRSRPPRTIFTLATRLHRGTVVAWIFTVGVVAMVLMSLSGSIQELVAQPGTSGEVFRDLLGGSAAYELFIAYICQMCGIFLASTSVGLTATYRQAVDNGTIDLIRSTGLRPILPLTAGVSVAAGTAAALVAALYTGGSSGLVTQGWSQTEDSSTLAWSAGSQLAPALLFIGITSCVMGFRTRAGVISWIALGIAAFVAVLGDLLSSPQWLIDSSPFTYTMTGADSDIVPLLLMSALGTSGAIVGIFASSQRDVG